MLTRKFNLSADAGRCTAAETITKWSANKSLSLSLHNNRQMVNIVEVNNHFTEPPLALGAPKQPSQFSRPSSNLKLKATTQYAEHLRLRILRKMTFMKRKTTFKKNNRKCPALSGCYLGHGSTFVSSYLGLHNSQEASSTACPTEQLSFNLLRTI